MGIESDVHWGYGLLTQGHLSKLLAAWTISTHAFKEIKLRKALDFGFRISGGDSEQVLSVYFSSWMLTFTESSQVLRFSVGFARISLLHFAWMSGL